MQRVVQDEPPALMSAPRLTRRTLLLSGAAFVATASMARADTTETSITVDSSGRTLGGTLAMPSGNGPFPVALIIAGSGPTDRDGNSPAGVRADTYRLLAAALATHGIASVRYDKRGIGTSASPPIDESKLHFSDYVDDAAAWLEELVADKRFSSVSVVGHSEGSLLGMMAAQRVKVHAYVSLSGLGRPAGPVLLDQLNGKLTPVLMESSRRIVKALEAGKLPGDVPPDLYSLFRPSVQPYLVSWFAIDPSKEIAKLKIPVAIVQGDTDIQVSTSEAQLLKDAYPAAKLTIVPHMTHVLKDVTKDVEQTTTYIDPTLPIDPAVTNAIVAVVSK